MIWFNITQGTITSFWHITEGKKVQLKENGTMTITVKGTIKTKGTIRVTGTIEVKVTMEEKGIIEVRCTIEV